MNYSNDERSHLAKLFLNEIAKQKSSQTGVQANGLSLRIVNGKRTLTQRPTAINPIIKASQSAPARVSRALRGQDSLVSKIYSEVKSSGEWLETVGPLSILTVREVAEGREAIDVIQRQTEDLAEKLGAVENSIESLKANDPVFARAEAVLVEVRQVREAGNAEQFEQLRKKHEELIRNYENRRRGLDPFLQAARVLRLEIQKNYWKIMQMHWSLQDMAIQVQLRMIFEYGQEAPAEERRRLYLIDKGDARILLDSVREALNKYASQVPTPRMELNASMDRYDNILPGMQALLTLQLDIYTQFNAKYSYQDGTAAPIFSPRTALDSRQAQ